MVYKQLISAASHMVSPEAFAEKLARKKTLTIKLGADPTSPDLHLGHAVILRALRRFQECGHTVIFLIGDFTARIGDPTGRSKARPPLTSEEIAHNSTTYFEQVGRIVDRDKIQVRYNSEWLGKLTPEEWVKLCAKVTLARLTEREDFAQRLATQTPIGFHELLYPLMQGYDSVALHADVELGGTDQLFNLLMGRFLQEHYGQEPQVTMTFPLLLGLDGVDKMSKSKGNTINLKDAPSDAFGKLMSISDELMWHYRAILLEEKGEDITAMQQAVARNEVHPMELKKNMAHAIIAQFWSPSDADQARDAFTKTFQQRDMSEVAPFYAPFSLPHTLKINELLKLLAPEQSSSELRRLITAGAVSVDQGKVTDPTASVTISCGTVIKIGKHRFMKISQATE